MATETILIEIKGDPSDIKKTTDALVEQGKVDKQNAKQFEKNSKKNKSGIDKMSLSAKEFNERYKKVGNKFVDTSKKIEKSVGKIGKEIDNTTGKSSKLRSNLLKIGAVIGVSLGVGAIVAFGKRLTQTAITMEAFEKRAKTVFGSSIEFVKEFAKENAKNLGLTENAFLGAAAAVGDILVPLGLSREKAAEMSTEAVKLGSALKEFTGDQRSAAEISDIVARSLTGEVEGLKSLGVVINQNDKGFKDLVKSKQKNLGLTLQQAKAEAIFETVLQRSGDALKAFETNTDSAARQQAKFNATIDKITENLALAFLPVVNNLFDVFNSLAATSRELTNELVAENKAFRQQREEITVLADRHDELQGKTELNKDEQIELEAIIQKIALAVPGAADEFDKYNKVIGINTDRIDENLDRQEEILRLKFKDRIIEINETIEQQIKGLERANISFNEYKKRSFYSRARIS